LIHLNIVYPQQPSYDEFHLNPTIETTYQQNDKELSTYSIIKTETNREKNQFSNHHRIPTILKANNEKNLRSTPINVPCLVCGDEASGFHYGVDSCEGCKVNCSSPQLFPFFNIPKKGFFRRCLNQKTSHHCNSTINCEITPLSRNSCPYCRLKKCFDVGMSRAASRLGRRPKRLQSDTSRDIKQQISTTKDSNILKLQTGIRKMRKTKLVLTHTSYPSSCVSSGISLQTSPDENDKQISLLNPIDSVSSSFQHRPQSLIPEIHREILRKLASLLIYQERLLTNIETKEMDHIANVIINAHLQFCVYIFEKIQIKIEENPPIWADSIVRRKTDISISDTNFVFPLERCS
jgi:nuclear receptor subfamily 1 group D protein 1